METHQRHQCPTFVNLKRKCSKASYVDVKLKSVDAEGYSAAGFVIVSRQQGEIEFLMAREERKPDSTPRNAPVETHELLNLLNFLGGKRTKKEQKSPIQVAKDITNAETGSLISASTLASMSCPILSYWSAQSKYALFFVESTEKDDYELDMKSASVAEEIRLEGKDG